MGPEVSRINHKSLTHDVDIDVDAVQNDTEQPPSHDYSRKNPGTSSNLVAFTLYRSILSIIPYPSYPPPPKERPKTNSNHSPDCSQSLESTAWTSLSIYP
jgi:hypothetical protein